MKIFILLAFIWAPMAMAKIGIGSGLSAAMAGRTHPLIYASIEGKKVGVTGYSTGASSSVSYSNAYQLNIFALFPKVGDFLWGSLEAGFGWGFHYYDIGLKYGDGLPMKKNNDFATGPAVRVLWNMLGPVFIAFEGMYGIRNLNAILLSSQDMTSLIVGVRF